jgi:hypothetical protein
MGHPAAMLAGGIGAVTTGVATVGRSAVSVATNPVVLGVAGDAALAYGVGTEAVAAYRGQCHP